MKAIERRLAALEAVQGGNDAGDSIEITPELREEICTSADDALAFSRLLSGDKDAIQDMSTDALEALIAAGDKHAARLEASNA